MNIQDKLRLIQEGFTMDEINSGNLPSLNTINEADLLYDYIYMNPEYISESSIGIIHESSDNIISYIGKFFKWIWDKIMQFIRFIKDKFTAKDKNKTYKININIPQKTLETIKTVNYKATVFSNVYDKDGEDFAKNGIGKIYSIIHERVKKIIDLSNVDTKVTMITDAVINEEKRFLDSVFKEAFNKDYSEEAIFDSVYGEKKQVTISPNELPKLSLKLKYLESQQGVIIKLAEDMIPKQLQEYKYRLDPAISQTARRLEHAKSINDEKTIKEETALLRAYKSRLQQLTAVYNHLFRITDEFLRVHRVVTFKFGDMLQKISDDISGKIKLETEKD